MATRRQRQKKKRERLSGRKRAEADSRDWSNTTLALPEGVEIFKPDPGVHKIDIIPYTTGEGNPFEDEGNLYFERTYWIYRKLGVDERSYCAPQRGSKDPVAEYRDANYKDTKSENYKALTSKKRQLWNVFDHDNPDAGVQIWEVSFHLFGKLLNSRITNSDEDEEFEYHSDPVDGYTLKITVEEKSLGDFSYNEVTAIDFKQRSALTPEVLDAAICLDELPQYLTYSELKKIFLQVEEANGDSDAGSDADEDEPDPEEKPKRRTRTRREPEKEEETPKTKRRQRRKPEPVEEEDDDSDGDSDAGSDAASDASSDAGDDDWDEDWDEDNDKPKEEKLKRGKRGSRK